MIFFVFYGIISHADYRSTCLKSKYNAVLSSESFSIYNTVPKKVKKIITSHSSVGTYRCKYLEGLVIFEHYAIELGDDKRGPAVKEGKTRECSKQDVQQIRVNHCIGMQVSRM